MPALKALELAYIRLQVPDLDAAERFYHAFGLVTRSRTDGVLYMRACGGEHRVLAVHQGERRLRSVAFELPTRAALEHAATLDGASPIAPLGDPGGGDCVTLRDPDGNLVELVHGVATSDRLPVHGFELNQAIARDRRVNRIVRPDRAPARVLRIGHVVLRSHDVAGLSRWYADTLGLLESDDVPLPGAPDDLLMSFVRLDQGAVPVDHHVMQFLHGGPGEVHHISFEVQGLDDLHMGHKALHAAGYRHVWGIGRHVQGSQIFDYWHDPFGVMYEHWTDTDMLDASAPKGFTVLDDMHNPWGPAMPEDFISQGTL